MDEQFARNTLAHSVFAIVSNKLRVQDTYVTATVQGIKVNFFQRTCLLPQKFDRKTHPQS